MLCDDGGLRRDLGVNADGHLTADRFFLKLEEWCRARRATTFAIVADDTAIGTISLSHRSEDGRTARIGYWVGTGYRHQGHCRRAFEAVLRQAAAQGITAVSATVDAGNEASRRIWERHGAASTSVASGRLRFDLATVAGVVPRSGSTSTPRLSFAVREQAMELNQTGDIEFSAGDESWAPQMGRWWPAGACKSFHLHDGFALVAHRRRQLIGCVSVVWRHLPPPLPDTQEAFIDFIEVHREQRRRGIARRLVQMAEARARDHGVCQIRAWSSEGKHEAIAMWQALGFSLCPADPKDEGSPGYYVAKRLD